MSEARISPVIARKIWAEIESHGNDPIQNDTMKEYMSEAHISPVIARKIWAEIESHGNDPIPNDTISKATIVVKQTNEAGVQKSQHEHQEGVRTEKLWTKDSQRIIIEFMLRMGRC